MSDMGLNLLLSTKPATNGNHEAGASASSAQNASSSSFDLAVASLTADFSSALTQAQQYVQPNVSQNTLPQNNGTIARQLTLQTNQNNTQQNASQPQPSLAANNTQQDNTPDTQNTQSSDDNKPRAANNNKPASDDAKSVKDTQDDKAQDDDDSKTSRADEINALLAKALMLLQGLASAQTSGAQAADTASSAKADTSAVGNSTSGGTQDPLKELLSVLARLAQLTGSGSAALQPDAETAADTAATSQSTGNDAFAQLVQMLQNGDTQLSASDLEKLAAMLNTGTAAAHASTDTLTVTQDTSALAAKPDTQTGASTQQQVAPTLLDALKQVFQIARAQSDAAAASTTTATNTSTPTAPVQTATTSSVVIAAVNASGANTQDPNSGDTGGNAAGRDSLALNASAPVQAPAQAQNTQAFSQMMDDVQNVQQASSPAEQVMAYVRAVASGGDSRIQIQLHPADLGSLDIKLSVSADGKTNLSVTADNPRTLDMLRSDAKQLTQMLTDIGLKADAGSLSFNLRGDQQPGQQWQQASQGQGYVNYGPPANDALDEALTQAPTQTYSLTSSDGVDIRI